VLAVARCLLLALNVLLLSSPDLLEPRLGGSRAFLLVTALITLVNLTLTWCWPRMTPSADAAPARTDTAAALVAATAVAIVIGATAVAWLREILIYPHDSARADMLVVAQLGIRRLLQGGDPYRMFQVPWDLALPYGPMLWAPLIAPHLLHADVRFVTLIGFLFVPFACAIVSAVEAARGRRWSSLGWAIVACAIAWSPALRQFVSIGHTPSYWPLLALFAWLVTQERWHAAAFLAGVLIVARTTMVCVAPVLAIAIWHRDRAKLRGALPLIAVTAVVPFIPFALWDWPALKYAVYGSYPAIVKNSIWPQIYWREHLIGVTGRLLMLGLQNYIEIIQVTALLAVYAASAVAMRAGRRPLPWMALALLAFSMTALWPVVYLYFDVCLLMVCGALSEVAWVRSLRPARAWSTVLAGSMLLVAACAWLTVPVNASIDAGTAADRPYLYSGFSSDEREGDVTFAWIDGTKANVLVPRLSRRDATIDLVCEPHLPARDAVQRLSASLNGTIIGTVTLTDGWQHVELAAPARAWQYGVNELTLFLSSAVSPKELGLSEDSRRLSLAVDRLMVRTP
jgi:hypothetical protein